MTHVTYIPRVGDIHIVFDNRAPGEKHTFLLVRSSLHGEWMTLNAEGMLCTNSLMCCNRDPWTRQIFRRGILILRRSERKGEIKCSYVR